MGEESSRQQEEQDTHGGDLTWPLLTCTRLLLVYQDLINGGTVRGCFKRTWVKGSPEGPIKALKLTMNLEENVTGRSVQMLQMDKALTGRRETWQPAV